MTLWWKDTKETNTEPKKTQIENHTSLGGYIDQVLNNVNITNIYYNLKYTLSISELEICIVYREPIPENLE